MTLEVLLWLSCLVLVQGRLLVLSMLVSLLALALDPRHVHLIQIYVFAVALMLPFSGVEGYHNI